MTNSLARFPEYQSAEGKNGLKIPTPESRGNSSRSQISGFVGPDDNRRVHAVKGGVGDALVAVDQGHAVAVSLSQRYKTIFFVTDEEAK